ncbi:hypothetical protein TD95_001250 [Thielaviopsis punctulata]|uniref:Mitochondrial carrier protein n=1 Tax=Thielaviopsis punctulata TaxID=72032 RepID=A0A0F4ZAV5_9PEZI|nr:hypothetical protein TD95_001250 [Thielaviopsis punctulata]
MKPSSPSSSALFPPSSLPDSSYGLLPVIPTPQSPTEPTKKRNAATAASAAGVRALSAQAIAFYFRAPAKAFFRMRVDYLAFARSLHAAETATLRSAASADPHASSLSRGWHKLRLWAHASTPGVLASAVRQQGWSIIPHQVLPPLIANVGVGAVLYTSYLHILGALHEESARGAKRAYPPPAPWQTFTAGFLAGGIQSVVAAPLDAIQARYDHRDLMRAGGKPQSMWSFSAQKMREIGLRGVSAGWTLSFIKDSMGSAMFFSIFEYVKAQGYYNFVSWYYGGLKDSIVADLALKRPVGAPEQRFRDGFHVIQPHYAIEPLFLLLAGISASFSQQVVLHPLTHVQLEHWDRLEDLDARAQQIRTLRAAPQPLNAMESAVPQPPRGLMLRANWLAYKETWRECKLEAAAEGRSLRAWLFRGFWWSTIRQVPSTSAGLVIFELVRRKYGMDTEEVRIQHDDYEILLN